MIVKLFQSTFYNVAVFFNKRNYQHTFFNKAMYQLFETFCPQKFHPSGFFLQADNICPFNCLTFITEVATNQINYSYSSDIDKN